MSLENKNAISYGAGGSIGGAVARTFAREGATVFSAGRTLASLEAVATDIKSAGGAADVAVLDALDEQAVDEHAQEAVSQPGSIDVSLNLITRGDVQGTAGRYAYRGLHPAHHHRVTANFISARAAARHMVEQGSGIILALDSGSANGSPMMGSTVPADAATDTFIRNLAAEIGLPRRTPSGHLDRWAPRDVP